MSKSMAAVNSSNLPAICDAGADVSLPALRFSGQPDMGGPTVFACLRALFANCPLRDELKNDSHKVRKSSWQFVAGLIITSTIIDRCV